MDEANRKLTSAATIVMFATVLSRITGYLRTVLISSLMGPKGYSDEFILAFTLPDLVYDLLAGGAIAAALIPVLSSYLTKNKEKVGWKAVGTFMNLSVILMLVLELIFLIWTDGLLGILAPGANDNPNLDKQQIIGLTRILLLSAPFMMLAGQCNGVLNAYKRFTAAAFGPVAYNLCTIVSIAAFGSISAEFVSWGIVVSAAIFFVLAVSASARHFKMYKPKLYLNSPAFKHLLILAVPSLISSTILEINLIISRGTATFMDAGMVTLLQNANKTWQLPLGIFAQSIGIALLPTLSEHHASDSVDRFKSVMYKGLRVVWLLCIPTALLFVILNQDIMRLLFNWGGQTETDVFYSGMALMGYAIALIFASTMTILTRSFYAVHDSKIPLFGGVLSIFVNLFFNYIFQNFTHIGIAGIALSYSISAFLNMLFLAYLFKRKTGIDIIYDNFSFLFKTALASVPTGLIAFALMMLIRPGTSKISQIFTLCVPVAAGLVLFWFVAGKFKIKEINDITDMFRSRLKRFIPSAKG